MAKRSIGLTNPLLKEPLQLKHVKPRLLGHWGTTPGLNFIYVHLNRVIKEYDLSVVYITGPGHGGPGLVANAYLEGTYSEVYPNIGQDEAGLKRLFTQFSFPGRHSQPRRPGDAGSIHEGGELGYALSRLRGRLRQPRLIVACVVGDGEAETGPLATGWHGNKFLNPARDGCVLPILHLNGYKIANPTVLARISHEELECPDARLRLHALFRRGERTAEDASAHGRDTRQVRIRNQDDPDRCPQERLHQAATLAMIVLHARGWTGPKEVDGKQDRGLLAFSPGAHGRHVDTRGTSRSSKRWMKSYKPEELFDEDGQDQARTGRAAAQRSDGA